MRRVLLLAQYAVLLVLAKVAGWLGCYVVRERELHECVKVLDTIARARHRTAFGRKAAARTEEDNYIRHVLAAMRRGVVPRRWRWR